MTTTTLPLAVLTHLDWHDLTCQHQDPECDHRATVKVEYHAVDECNYTGNPFGNIVELLCTQCLDRLKARIDSHIRQLARTNCRAQCFTCGAPIAETTDILRSVRPLQ
ncbi:hypothetical protein [Mycobacterium canetti]|uniref:hypothetical protein n=1 Tax=Mycobacterium canetti TaxID=78331 RepID=UPI00034D1FD1|nr:hypothetical protein [Mycobacterium canetti]